MATSPIPVRLSAVLLARLDKVGVRLGVPRTQVIKMCLLAFLQRFEREGLGMLPPDWEDQIRQLDGRTQRYNVVEMPTARVAEETPPPPLPPAEQERLRELREQKRHRPKKDKQ